MKLFFRKSGQGTPLIILHGLFGSSDNWHTLAKTFALKHTVYLLDQRNHGQSPHSDAFSYKLLSDDLLEFMDDHKIFSANIIGHSMGGKAAMNFAIRHGERVERLMIVDIVPKPYSMRYDAILEGMKQLPLDTVTSRIQAEEVLTPFVPDVAERQFILKNLVRSSGSGFEWKVNLKSLDKHMSDLGVAMEYQGTFGKPTLFLMGSRSNYFKPGDETTILSFFPGAEIRMINTGHWVQAEDPAGFAAVVADFFRQS